MRHEQIAAITRNITALTLSRIGIAAIAVGLLHAQVPLWALLPWLAVFLAKTLADWRQWRRYHAVASVWRSTPRQQRAILLDAAAFGVIWAGLVLFLLADLPPVDSAFLMVLVAAVMLFSIMTMHPMLGAAYSYIFPITLAFLIVLPVIGQPNLGAHLGLAVTLLLMGVLVTRNSHLAFTEGVVLKLQNRRLLEDTRSASRAKSEFIANMSHELRTPLNAIIGFAEVMRAAPYGPLESHYSEYAQDIEGSGRHLLALINDILDLSKIEAGRMNLREQAASLQDIADSCMALLRPRAEEGKVRLESDLPPGLPDLWIDPLKFKQILLNLLSNAVKFTGPGGQVALRAAVAEDGDLVVTVADTGIGIAPEHIAVVLQPFGQVDNRLSRSHTGTGLGLPLARRLIELHGGELDLHSRPGQGTEVHIRLPAARLSPDVLSGAAS